MGSTSDKLTYLNDTKTLLRTNINAIGGDIDDDDTFRSYATELDNMWENLPHTTGSGTNISLNNTKKGKAKVDLSDSGNTSQDSTTGKNLCNATTISVDGNSVYFQLDRNKLQKIFTLSFTSNVSLTSNTIYMACSLGSNIVVGTITGSANSRISQTVTLSDENYEKITSSTWGYFSIYKSGAGFTNPTDAQIENGSSMTDYEPYTNGPSPNPDFPQKVETAKGSYKITTCKKNLCNPDELYEQMKNISSNTTKVTIDNRNCIKFRSENFHEKGIYLTTYKENTQYTFRFVAKPVDTFNKALFLVIMYADGTKKQTKIEGYDSWDELRVVSDANKTIDYFYFSYGTTVDWYIDADSFNIIEGATTNYELFQGDTYNIDLPVENKFNPPSNFTTTFGIGGVRTLKVEDGKFYIGGTSGGTSSYISLGSDYTIKDGDYLHILNNQEVFAILFFPQSGDTTIAQFTIDSINKIIDLSSYAGQTISRIKLYVNPNQGDKQYTFSPMILNGISRLTSFTPYGTTPIKLNKISTYKDGFVRSTGINIINQDNFVKGSVDSSGNYGPAGVDSFTNSNGVITFTTTLQWRGTYSDFIPIEGNTPYQVSYNKLLTTNISYFAYYNWFDEDKVFIERTTVGTSAKTSPANAKYCLLFIGINEVGTGSISEIMMVKGDYTSSTIPSYQPYGDGDWYLKKATGEYAFTGNETWGNYDNTATGLYKAYSVSVKIGRTNSFEPYGYSDYFTLLPNYSSGSTGIGYQITKNAVYLAVSTSTANSTSEMETWIGNNKPIIYYILATPTYTKLNETYPTLTEQLETAWRANTFDGQTNISQINNDLPLILGVTALEAESEGE